MSDPTTPDSPGEVLPPASGVPPTSSAVSPDAGRALAVVSRLARSHPSSDELRCLLEGKLGEAVSAAADYAADAITPATRAAYIRDWDVFATWCREQGADPMVLPAHPVLVAAYIASLAGTIGKSALRGRLAAIAYHHRRRGLTWLRIPMKSPGYTDLKPPGVPISKRAPFQSQIARDGVVS